MVHEQFQEGDYKEEYDILFDDHSSIVGRNSIDVFNSDEFKRRRCERLYFTYRSKELDNQIEIKLYNSLLTLMDSTVEISSKDREWYHSICNEILTIVNEVEKQKLNITLGVKYFGPMIIGVIEGLVFSSSLDKIFLNAFTNSQSSAVAVLSSIIFMWLNSYFFGLIEKAYPNIEFSFGPIYLNKSQKIRNSLGIVIPFLFDLIFFVLGFIV